MRTASQLCMQVEFSAIFIAPALQMLSSQLCRLVQFSDKQVRVALQFPYLINALIGIHLYGNKEENQEQHEKLLALLSLPSDFFFGRITSLPASLLIPFSTLKIDTVTFMGHNSHKVLSHFCLSPQISLKGGIQINPNKNVSNQIILFI